MPIKRRLTKTRKAAVSVAALHLLSDGFYPAPEDPSRIAELKFFFSDAELRALWEQCRDEILSAWVSQNPGTRPPAWWRYDAPRATDEQLRSWSIEPAHYLMQPANRPCSPRRRLSGIGTPGYEVLCEVPRFAHGIPVNWITQAQVDLYNGRSHDIHGKPIGTEYQEGHFPGIPPDPSDPPVFESEPSYLKRHALFQPSEERRLKPEDFEPETLAEEQTT